MQQKFDSSTTDSKHRTKTKHERESQKKKENHFQRAPPKKNKSSLSNGGLNGSLPFLWPEPAVVAIRFTQDPRASSCAAGCHAPAEEGERAVPHEAGTRVAPLSGGETIWMGSDLMNRMNVMIL